MKQRWITMMSLVLMAMSVLMLLAVSPVFAISAGHVPTENIGYTNGFHARTYAAAPNMRQGSDSLAAAKSSISNADATDLYVNFTNDTTGWSVFVVYTTDGTNPTKSNGTCVQGGFSKFNDPDRTFYVTIPSSANTAGTTVKYVFYANTTGGACDGTGLSNANRRVASEAGGVETSWTEGNTAYSYTARYCSNQTGNWNTNSTWVGNSVPPSGAEVEICNGDTVTLDTDPTIRLIRINNGGTLQDTGDANTLTLRGVTDKSNSFTNAGTFTSGSGTVIIEGESGTFNLSQVSNSSSHVFNNVTVQRSSGAAGYGVDFFDNTNRAKIDGIFTIGTFGYVAQEGTSGDGRPIYGASSTLRYNSAHTEGDPFNSNEEWDQGTGWTVGTSPAAPQNVEISSNDWVSLNANPWERRVGGNLTIAAGSGLILQNDNTANLKVAGTATNNGTIKQTATLNSSSFHFANIQDASNADKYYGVNISTSANLGSTTVAVMGNQSTCTHWNGTQPIVKRCYSVTPTSADSAAVTFYYQYDELNSLTPANLFVWRDNGNGTWNKIVPDSRSDCTSGIACSVTVNSLSLSAGANRYVLSPANPTAITLAEFSAQQVGDHVRVTWQTASELNNRGFNLYRGVSPDGWDRQLNTTLIPSQGQGSPSGFTYTWLDEADLVAGTTYYYWLQDVDLSGAMTMHGPVSVDFTVPTAVTLNGVQASPAAAGSLPWLWIVAAAGAALGAARFRRRG